MSLYRVSLDCQMRVNSLITAEVVADSLEAAQATAKQLVTMRYGDETEISRVFISSSPVSTVILED